MRLSDTFQRLVGTNQQAAEDLGFVSGHRFSDAIPRSVSITPLAAAAAISTFPQLVKSYPFLFHDEVRVFRIAAITKTAVEDVPT